MVWRRSLSKYLKFELAHTGLGQAGQVIADQQDRSDAPDTNPGTADAMIVETLGNYTERCGPSAGSCS